MRDVKRKNSSNYKIFWIFQWLWLIVLLPKVLQLFLYLGIIFLLVIGNRNIRLNKTAVYLMIFATIHLLSIMINIIRFDFETERIYAAFNTCALWYVGAFYYSFYSSEKLNQYDMKFLFKCLYRNSWILIFLCFLTKFLSIENINIAVSNIVFWSEDWLDGTYSLRFSGGLGYATLVSEFTLIFFPFSILYLLVYRKRNYCLITIFSILMAYTNYSCHSRVGMVLFGVELILTVYFLICSNKKGQRIKNIIILIFAICMILLLLFYGKKLYMYFLNLVNSREGSNETRTWIYITSLTKTWTESPLLGLGVKIQPGDYPLGSHSTYIGVFYKTGIIGSLVFIFAFASLICKQWSNSKKVKYGKFMFLTFIIYLVMLCLEDLDGYDWLIISFFAVMGIYNSFCKINSKKIIL